MTENILLEGNRIVNVQEIMRQLLQGCSDCGNELKLTRLISETKSGLGSYFYISCEWPGRVAQSVGHLTRKSGVLGSIPGLATYFRFSFRFFKKGSCQLLAKVCARSTG